MYIHLMCNKILGEAIDYLRKNAFVQTAGARKGFPKIAVIITDGKSQDEVEIPAKELQNLGVEVFTLGKNIYLFYYIQQLCTA